MPKVTEQYRASKRDDIAHAAMRAFLRKGFQGASMADIIAEAGLSAGAIYGHYKSKEELVLDVASRVVAARVGEVTDLLDKTPMLPPGSVVRVLLSGMLRDLGEPSMLIQLWGEAITDDEVRRLAAGVIQNLRRTFRNYISVWHQRTNGLDADAADALAEEQAPLFLAASQGYLLQRALFDDFDGEAYLATVEKYLPR